VGVGGEGGGENGALSFFGGTWGVLKGQLEGWGIFFNNGKKISCAIFWYYV